MKEDSIFLLNTFEEHIKNSTTNEKDHQTNNNISSSISLNTDESSELKLCETHFIYKKEKYLVDSKQNKIISLYSTFKFLKEKYGLNNKRKNRIDCIIKKVKTKYLNAIHESIKFCVNLYIHRLPQNFITNIKIEYNKLYLNKTVEQIYTEFKILPSLNELIEQNLIKKGKKELLIILMNNSLKDIYNYYLSSQLYIYDRMYIKNKEGENVAKLYDYIAQNICQYFLYNKGNKKKPIINNNCININNNVYENNLYDTNNINSDKIIIQKDIDNNFITYDCKNEIKDNNFRSLEENKICKKNIKFNIVKAK
jgi:hypothetical protein